MYSLQYAQINQSCYYSNGFYWAGIIILYKNKEIKSTLKKWDFLGVKQDPLNKVITLVPTRYLISYHISCMSKYAVPLGTTIASVLHPFMAISNSQLRHFAILFFGFS